MNESTAALVAALEEANRDGELDAIIADARAEHFHDFHENAHDLPQVELINRLRIKRGTRGLIDRVHAGEFDATRAEADAWAASPEGQAVFAELLAPQRGRRDDG